VETESALAVALAALGFSSVPDFVAWANEADEEQRAATLEWLMSFLISRL